ncbi:YbjQ family protein [Mycoplasmatota bacterium]|nr:YbjQ family protein [Mycoplasmatota bacterium]
MIISTTHKVVGKEIVKHVGYVKGSTVRAKHVGKDIAAGFKTLFGGEIKGYADMMNEARQIAVGRMVEDAKAQGANAIVGFRLQTSSVMTGASEIIAYGTAVIVEE